MIALTTCTPESEGSLLTESAECENEPLTATNNGNPESCANPLSAQPITIKSQKGKRYCSDSCPMDGYAQAGKGVAKRIGLIRFDELMDEV